MTKARRSSADRVSVATKRGAAAKRATKAAAKAPTLAELARRVALLEQGIKTEAAKRKTDVRALTDRLGGLDWRQRHQDAQWTPEELAEARAKGMAPELIRSLPKALHGLAEWSKDPAPPVGEVEPTPKSGWGMWTAVAVIAALGVGTCVVMVWWPWN